MDLTSVIAQIEAAVTAQLNLAGDDPAVEEAGEVILDALGPALRQSAIQLAEQAANEVAAQLVDTSIDVVISDGEPNLLVRSTEQPVAYTAEDLAARITLRLPEHLKAALEDAAGEVGESMNAYVVKRLSSSGGVRRRGRRISGTFTT